MRSFLKKLRVQLWWNHIVPPFLATIYFIVWQSSTYISLFWLNLLLFLISVIGCAAFGYFINDIFDIEVDSRAGKSNSASGLSVAGRTITGVALLLTGLIPWLWLPQGVSTIGLVFLLLLSLLIYSVPPLRFKERGFLGLICDIHYGHVLPVFIAVNTFGTIYNIQWSSGLIDGTLLYLLLFSKGLRNILCHQVGDVQCDAKAGIKTFTIGLGIEKISRLINIVLVIELIMLILLLSRFSYIISIPFVIFIVVNLLLVIIWGTFQLPVKARFSKLWFILNDFYEEWLPFFLAIILVVKYPKLWWLLLLHILLFSRAAINMARDVRKIVKWLYLLARSHTF